MGYRSDIRILTTKDGFEKLKEFVKKYLEEKKLDIKEYNLLEELDTKADGKEQCYFGWNGLKWYEGDYPEVDAIRESYDDIEEQSYDGEKDNEICLEYPNMIREFDDEYLKDLIEDKKLENLEENKEEIDI